MHGSPPDNSQHRLPDGDPAPGSARAGDEPQRALLERLARAGEYHEDAFGQHAQRVGATAARLGQVLGLDDTAVEQIRLAAPLHDLGKVGIPDALLLKPSRLTGEE